MNDYSVIVIGAGLSGLHSTWQLQQQNKKVLLLEARSTVGGRILTQNNADLGPAWVWPMMQPRLNHLLNELQLDVIKQYTGGDHIYQLSHDRIERYQSESGHSQSYRLDKGIVDLSDALLAKINPKNLLLNAEVTQLKKIQHGITVETHQNSMTADQVIIALPPRLLIQNIKMTPQLDANTSTDLNSLPTWMAGQAKMVFEYETAFWRERQLSGEAMSQIGPLREINDACNSDCSFKALSAFVGLNALQRSDVKKEELIQASLAQLSRYFGTEALKPINVSYKDWSQDRLTCSKLDVTTPSQHPHYPAQNDRHVWDKRLLFSGSELAVEHGGYLEGAIESSEQALSLINL